MTSISYQLYSSRKDPDPAGVLPALAALGYERVEGYGGLFEDQARLARLKADLEKTGLAMPTAHFGIEMVEKEPDRVVQIARTLGIDAYVNPRNITISRVLQHVRRGRIRAVHTIQRGAAEIIEAEALETSSLVGAELRDLDLPDGMRIGAIWRDGKMLKPGGHVRIRPGDRVVIFALQRAVKQVEQMFRVSLEFF